MYKIDGYSVDCLVEEYRDGWRSVVRISRTQRPTIHSHGLAQYAVPAVLPTKDAAQDAAVRWAYWLIEKNRDNVEIALNESELDEMPATSH
jgi:hypothetical protein